MEDHDAPNCSRGPTIPVSSQHESICSKEMISQTLEHSTLSVTPETPKSFSVASKIEITSEAMNAILLMRPSIQTIITSQPLPSVSSPRSVVTEQPHSFFIQALSKLNESSLSFALINHLKSTTAQQASHTSKFVHVDLESGELSPPDSLTSAPPSYSFVLRQMAVRRRPRLMGTFIPSPSFVQHTPPPNYATAFDIYVDNPLPPPPPRAYNFGFASMLVVCPECGYAGMTAVTTKVTLCTHLCAFILCVLCCWICVPLPYIIRSCKDVYHYCRNCRNLVGMYRPTNPDSTYHRPSAGVPSTL